jgi:proteic killer suppression protein
VIGEILIRSFSDKTTEDLFHGNRTAKTRRLSKGLSSAALIKLDILNAAATIQDLRSPPGNRLEELKGNYAGSHSIRVNDQWRLVFRFEGGNVFDVQLTDYH